MIRSDLARRARHWLRLRATWLVTGPLGHLVAGLLDWFELLARYWWVRLRGRPIA